MTQSLPTYRRLPLQLSGCEVRALLAGRKRQIRLLGHVVRKVRLERICDGGGYKTSPSPWCTLQAGDEICVRESLAWNRETGRRCYSADGKPVRLIPESSQRSENALPGSISFHQKSRLLLQVTRVHCELLQQLNEEEAIAEGIQRTASGLFVSGRGQKGYATAVQAYRHLWMTLHKRPGERWEDNPQVVVAHLDVTHIGRVGAAGFGRELN
jgi:hypothetical protein